MVQLQKLETNLHGSNQIHVPRHYRVDGPLILDAPQCLHVAASEVTLCGDVYEVMGEM